MVTQESANVVPTWVPRDRFPFESKFVDVEGHRLHFIDEGSGPIILFFHGNPTWCFLYRNIIAKLRLKFRCIAVDYPGFGLSRAASGYDFLPSSHARVISQFVNRLGIPEFSVMVQDWGGPIGLWLAAREPARIRGIIIGNTWAWPVDGDLHFERFSKLMGGAIGRFAIRYFNAFVNVMIPTGVKRKKLDRQVMTAYRGPFPTPDSRLPTNVFPREILGSHAFLQEVRTGLAQLETKPTLILWGDRDVAFRDREKQQFETLFPRHRTVMLPGAGHFIQEDAPEEITVAIENWWDSML